ncbi:hypothetical protein IAT40_000727 [Kwoniella sp. CBS 6097]
MSPCRTDQLPHDNLFGRVDFRSHLAVPYSERAEATGLPVALGAELPKYTISVGARPAAIHGLKSAAESAGGLEGADGAEGIDAIVQPVGPDLGIEAQNRKRNSGGLEERAAPMKDRAVETQGLADRPQALDAGSQASVVWKEGLAIFAVADMGEVVAHTCDGVSHPVALLLEDWRPPSPSRGATLGLWRTPKDPVLQVAENWPVPLPVVSFVLSGDRAALSTLSK